MTVILSVLAVTGCVSFAAIGQEDGPALPPVRVGPESGVDHRPFRVGELVRDFQFTAIDGSVSSISAYAGGKPIVVSIRDLDCPLSKKYGPRLAEIEARFADNLRFLFVNPSEIDVTGAMLEECRTYGFMGKYVADRDQRMARLLGVNRTTDVFVLDQSRTLVYRGAIDDQYGLGYAHPEPRSSFLVDAIQAVLQGSDVPVMATIAPGCVIELEEGEAPASAHDTRITYHNRISRLIQQNCETCHRQDGVAPFALQSYEQARAKRSMIRYVVENQLMPPWHASESSHQFANDRSLTDRDRKALLAWIEDGCEEGDENEAPVPRRYSAAWQIGEPDYVVRIPKVERVPADGALDYRYQWVQTQLPEDKWIAAMEIRPTSPQVVHHALVFIEDPPREGESRRDIRARWQGGLNGYFAGLVPGQATTVYPEGLAKKLPAGAWLKFQVHYTPNGTACEDQTEIGFTFRDDPPEREMVTSSAHTERFRIAPGEPNYEVVAWTQFREPAVIYSFAPHMHVRGKAFRYELFLPDDSSEVLLDIPRYDFNWQTRYRLREPVEVPVGARLKCTAWYDNSKDNPANPDPSRTVTFGEQTWDEMMIGYFEYWVTAEHPASE